MQEPPGVKKRPCGEFEVTWKPPLDSGGGPLIGYQVQLKLKMENDGWRNCTAFFSNHNCLFTDLRSKTEYHVRVRAFNQKGPGQWAFTSETTDLIGKSFILRANPCKNRPKSPIRGKAQKIKIALLLQTGRH